MNYKKFFHKITVFSLLCILSSCGCEEKSKSGNTVPDPETIGLAAADFILSLQNSDGRIMDCPESDVVNEDSNMEYACIGLAAAYKYSGEERYLEGLEKAIKWLAARQEMTDAAWKGSWYYAYDVNAPYSPFPLSLGEGIDDARGVDATSALFVYILYLHKKLSGDSTLAVLYEDNARAALDFLLSKNYDSSKYFYSSWHKISGSWILWKYRYSADQGDVYLGMKAGYLLYGDDGYKNAADNLTTNVPADFYDSGSKNFATGMEEDNSLDTELYEFNSIFPQGYLGWVFGSSSQTEASYSWLKSHVAEDAGIYCYTGDPGYSLSIAVFALAADSLGHAAPKDSFYWIIDNTYDEDDGGILDTEDNDSEKFSNVAGFTAAAMLGFKPF